MSTSGGASGGGSGDISTAHATLNAAAIATLNSVPVTIVGAPGALHALVVVQAAVEFKVGVDGFASTFSPVVCYGSYSSARSAANILGNPLVPSDAAPFSAVSVRPGDASAAAAEDRYTRTIVENTALVVTNVFDVDRSGPIVTASVAAGGTGYAVGDTGVIQFDLWDSVAAYVIDTVNVVTGAVLTFHLVGAGNGYSLVDNPIATTNQGGQPGVGVNFTVNVDAIAPADGTLYVTVLYQTITLH